MRMSRSPQNGGFHRWTGGGPLRAACPNAPAMASSPLGVCPSFAMVCLEPGTVTGCFHRDRDRTQAYPLPPAKPGPDGKSSRFAGLRDPFGSAGPGAMADLQESDIAPVKNSVIFRRLSGIGA